MGSSFEGGCKRIRETPDRPRPEFLIFGLEVEVVNRACEGLRRLQFAPHESLVDDYLRGDVGQFTPLPGFHLLPFLQRRTLRQTSCTVILLARYKSIERSECSRQISWEKLR